MRILDGALLPSLRNLKFYAHEDEELKLWLYSIGFWLFKVSNDFILESQISVVGEHMELALKIMLDFLAG